MGRNVDRVIDKTFLSLDGAEERGLIHRDYIAHCFRWSHVVKNLLQGHAYKDAVILDVGCGKELPLAKTLYVNKMSPRSYVGVDVNKLTIPDMLMGKKIPIALWSETDFTTLAPSDVGLEVEALPDSQVYWEGQHAFKLPNFLTCFEVLEHVTPEHARRMLIHFGEVTSEDVSMFISTPCWNGSAAENHINEMTYGALGALIEDLGYKIVDVYGTFASISDYKHKLGHVEIYDDGRKIDVVNLQSVYAALRSYYDTNVLSTIFAPLFPEASRNCLWHLRKKTGDQAKQKRLFPALMEVPTPWSQHKDYLDLLGGRSDV